jgi:hypothetical protein
MHKLWFQNGLKTLQSGTVKVTEKEFLDAIKWLVNNKIILLEQTDSITPEQQIASDAAVSKPRINQCVTLYTQYKNLGTQNFLNKFPHIVYLKDCVKLYKDPVWKYQGADRIDKLYEKFIEFREQSKATQVKLSSDPSVKINSIVEIGTSKYLVSFNLCAGTAGIDKAKVLVQSAIESVQVGSNKDIPPESCRTYETQINANFKDNIKINLIERVLQ